MTLMVEARGAASFEQPLLLTNAKSLLSCLTPLTSHLWGIKGLVKYSGHLAPRSVIRTTIGRQCIFRSFWLAKSLNAFIKIQKSYGLKITGTTKTIIQSWKLPYHWWLWIWWIRHHTKHSKLENLSKLCWRFFKLIELWYLAHHFQVESTLYLYGISKLS